MKNPEFKKMFRDTPKPQDTLVHNTLELATLKGSQETHILEQKENLEDQLEYQKDLIEDYSQQIKDLEEKQSLAEDIFTIAKNPSKFIDPSENAQSQEDIQKIINEIVNEKRKETTLMNRIKMQLAKIKNIIPTNPQDN